MGRLLGVALGCILAASWTGSLMPSGPGPTHLLGPTVVLAQVIESNPSPPIDQNPSPPVESNPSPPIEQNPSPPGGYQSM
jgi:hypothetical protein